MREVVPPPGKPHSLLFTEIDVAESELISAIERAVPVQLARAQDRAIGAPGKATYTVRRGRPRLQFEDQTVEVIVPISATIDVCKPIGSMCLGYGHCEPEFEASFRLSSVPGQNYQWGAPRGQIKTKKKCVIGIDVTPQLESLARQEMSRVEQQVKSELPRLDLLLQSGLEAARSPIALGDPQDKGCFRASIERTLFLPPRKEGQRIRLGVGARGELEPIADCRRAATRQSLPLSETLAVPKAPSQSVVWFSRELSLPYLRETLHKKLTNRAPGTLQVRDVELLLTSQGVAFRLELTGNVCGSFWILTRQEVDETERILRFLPAELDETLGTELRSFLVTWMKERAEVSLESLFRQREQGRALLERELRSLQEGGITLRGELKAKSGEAARVVSQSDGLVVHLPLHAQVGLSVEKL